MSHSTNKCNMLNFLWCSVQIFMFGIIYRGRASATECESMTASNKNQTIFSPNWPRAYPPNTMKCWNISARKNDWISFSLEELYLEDSFDYLSIESGNVTRQVTGEPCLPLRYLTNMSSVVIRFKSDHDIQMKGFRGIFRAINSREHPNGLDSIRNESKLFKLVSPGVDSSLTTPCQLSFEAIDDERMFDYTSYNGYPPEANCTTTISGQFGRRIRIEFEIFESELCCDYLILLDGGYPARLLQGSQCPAPYTSSTSNLTFIFRSDQMNSGLGFVARFKTVNQNSSSSEEKGNQQENFFSSASSRLATNHLFCETQVNQNVTNQDLEKSLFTVDSFWFFPFETTFPSISQSRAKTNEVCNSSTAVENLRSILRRPNLTITKSLLEDAVEVISDLFGQTEEPSVVVPGFTPNSMTTNSNLTTYRSLLRDFYERAVSNALQSANETSNETQTLFSFRTQNIDIQIVRSAPLFRSENGSSLTFPNETINLSNRGSSKNISVFIPADTVYAVSRRSNTDYPIFVALMIGNISTLNKDQKLSQVASLSAFNSSSRDLPWSFQLNGEEKPPDKTKINGTVNSKLQSADLVQWDFKKSSWEKSDRCQNTSTMPLAYKCKDLKTLATLFSTRVVPSVVVLEIFSQIGSWLSVIFLSATIVIYLGFRELREKPTTMLLVNICACLIAIYLLFNLGVGYVEGTTTCNVLAFLMHYVTLTCMTLMTVNAYQMYKAFSVMRVVKLELKPIVYLAIYGVPFIWSFINFSVTILYLDKASSLSSTSIYYESLYRARHMCWLQKPSFYYGFLLPFGILLVFNYVVFMILLKKVVFRKTNIRSTARDQSIVDRLTNAFFMVTLMGLTWIFGYFLLIPWNVAYETAMQWLFTLSNVFQGLVIFFLNCLRRENVRKIWLCCLRKSTTTTTSNSTSYQNQHNTKDTTELHSNKNESVM